MRSIIYIPSKRNKIVTDDIQQQQLRRIILFIIYASSSLIYIRWWERDGPNKSLYTLNDFSLSSLSMCARRRRTGPPRGAQRERIKFACDIGPHVCTSAARRDTTGMLMLKTATLCICTVVLFFFFSLLLLLIFIFCSARLMCCGESTARAHLHPVWKPSELYI